MSFPRQGSQPKCHRAGCREGGTKRAVPSPAAVVASSLSVTAKPGAQAVLPPLAIQHRLRGGFWVQAVPRRGTRGWQMALSPSSYRPVGYSVMRVQALSGLWRQSGWGKLGQCVEPLRGSPPRASTRTNPPLRTGGAARGGGRGQPSPQQSSSHGGLIARAKKGEAPGGRPGLPWPLGRCGASATARLVPGPSGKRLVSSLASPLASGGGP